MSCDDAKIPSPPTLIAITLPGGIELKALAASGPGMIATDLSMISSLMTQLGPALGALSPALKVIDAVTSMFTVLQRAPEIPVDPAGFLEALAEAAEKVGALAPLIPQVSIPATIATSITAVAKFARAIRDQVAAIATEQTTAQALKDTAEANGDAALAAEAQCALDNASALMEHASASMEPLAALLDIITGLMSFIPSPVGLPTVPDTSDMTPQQLLDALDVLVETLEAISIPGA
jgi:hypothetical protein